MERLRPLIAGNWKMHTLPSEAPAWLRRLLERLDEVPHDHCRVALAVPFPHLPAMVQLARGSDVAIGAQDVSPHAQGAHTGEVSADMLRDVGARYVVVGHSERRADHGESDALVNAKARAAMAQGLIPIVCVGELEQERLDGRAEAVVLAQLAGSLAGLEPADADALVVAYEPVWAIGTGRTATADDAQAMAATLRAALRERFPGLADRMRVLYGGSMKPANAAELLAKPDVNGGLIGGASLDVDQLVAIVEAAR